MAADARVSEGRSKYLSKVSDRDKGTIRSGVQQSILWGGMQSLFAVVEDYSAYWEGGLVTGVIGIFHGLGVSMRKP